MIEIVAMVEPIPGVIGDKIQGHGAHMELDDESVTANNKYEQSLTGLC